MTMFPESVLLNALVEYTSLVRINACTTTSVGLNVGKSGLAIALFEVASIIKDKSIEEEAVSLLKECLISTKNIFTFAEGWGGIACATRYLMHRRLLEIDYDEILGEKEGSIVEMMHTRKPSIDKVTHLHNICSYSPLFYDNHNKEAFSLIKMAFDELFKYHSEEWTNLSNNNYNTSVHSLLKSWHQVVHNALRFQYLPKPSFFSSYRKCVERNIIAETALEQVRVATLCGKTPSSQRAIPTVELHPLITNLEDLISLHILSPGTRNSLKKIWEQLLSSNNNSCERVFARYTSGLPIHSFQRGAARILLFLCWLLIEKQHRRVLKQLLC